MDYVATYPKAYIRYYASKMILNIESDAAYLIAPKHVVGWLATTISREIIQKILNSMVPYIQNVRYCAM